MENNNENEEMDSWEFINWAKGFIIIGVILLLISLSNEQSLLHGNGAIRIVFDFEYPFASKDFVRLWGIGRRYKISSVLIEKGLVLNLHGYNPLRMK